MAGIGGYSPETARMILDVVQYLQQTGLVPQTGRKKENKIPTPQFGYIFQTPSGGIPARSGTTLGSAACTPYYVDSSGDLQEILNPTDGTSQTETVYHMGASAIGGSRYIMAKRIGGIKIADFEDCA